MSENLRVIQQIKASLPEGITLTGISQPVVSGRRPDFQGWLKTQNTELPVVIEFQNSGGTVSFREAVRQVKLFAAGTDKVPFVAGLFFGEKIRQIAKEEGVGIMDLAGNFYLQRDDIYIERIVEKNPFTQKIPLRNLFAAKSSRISRVLLAQPQKSWLLSELAREASVSLGQTHKVIRRMIEEELLQWNQARQLTLQNPAQLLEAWSSVYSQYKVQKFSFMSFLPNLNAILSSVTNQVGDSPYAASHFCGADLVAPWIRGLTKAQFYVPQLSDVEKWKKSLDLQEVESGANVELYLPYDQSVFYQLQHISTSFANQIPVVSNIQLYLDLASHPARGAEQAEHLRESQIMF